MATMMINLMIPSDGNGKGRGGGCGPGGSAADWPWPVIGRGTTFDGRCHVQELVTLGSSCRNQATGLGMVAGRTGVLHSIVS